MKNKAKLIILYGFAGSGKTTIAKKYIDSHPLSMMIEGDDIINMMGQWRKFEKEARDLVYKHTHSIVKNQLEADHVVILPYLLTDASQIDSFEEIANQAGCPIYEIYIDAEKEMAIARLLERGRWGEVGSPLLTIEDRPEIEDLFNVMEREMSKRKNVISLKITRGDIDSSYKNFLDLFSH